MKKILTLIIMLCLLSSYMPVSRVVAAPSNVVGRGSVASCNEASLRQAVSQGGTVTFNCGSGPVTILINSEIEVPRNTTIDGGGNITIDAQGKSRIFKGGDFANIRLLNLTLKNGWVDKGVDKNIENGRGAALKVGYKSQVYIDRVNFINNRAMANFEPCAGGGAIWFATYSKAQVLNSSFVGNFSMNGGAINSLLTDLTVYNSVFENNQAMHDATINQFEQCGGGGAIYIDGAFPQSEGGSRSISISKSIFRNNKTNLHGGGIVSFLYSNDQMVIDETVIENNSSVLFPGRDADNNLIGGTGGGLWHGGEFSDPNRLYTGKMILKNSTVSGNHADYIGGGIWAYKPVSLTNVTITGNSASNSGSYTTAQSYMKGVGGGITLDDGSSLTNVTLTNNTAGFVGGAIAVLGARTSVNATLANTIFANNSANGANYQETCTSQLVDVGGNIQTPGKTSDNRDRNCSASVTVADPRVSSLANNGGTTRTVALQSGSPAINTGNSAYCPARDQRFYVRPNRCDSGAFEFGGAPFKASDWLYLPLIRK